MVVQASAAAPSVRQVDPRVVDPTPVGLPRQADPTEPTSLTQRTNLTSRTSPWQRAARIPRVRRAPPARQTARHPRPVGIHRSRFPANGAESWTRARTPRPSMPSGSDSPAATRLAETVGDFRSRGQVRTPDVDVDVEGCEHPSSPGYSMNRSPARPSDICGAAHRFGGSTVALPRDGTPRAEIQNLASCPWRRPGSKANAAPALPTPVRPPRLTFLTCLICLTSRRRVGGSSAPRRCLRRRGHE